MAKAAAESARQNISLRQKAYDDLKSLILRGQLRPGERLSENRLAERLGVSRTPLREALMKLDEEGLVVGQRNLGYVVADFDIAKACDLLRVRAALDACAAELACQTATEDDFARIRSIIARMVALKDAARVGRSDAAQDLDLGIEIHKVIAAATRNEPLMRMTDQVYQHLQMALWLEVLFVEFDNLDLDEHMAIADAVLARDSEAAALAARRHVLSTLDNMTKVRERLERLQTQRFTTAMRPA